MTDTAVKKKQWYEISIGINPGKTWFIVDLMPEERRGVLPELCHQYEPRTQVVETKFTNGLLSEVIVRAKFADLPTLADVLRVVAADTTIDHREAIYGAMVGIST